MIAMLEVTLREIGGRRCALVFGQQLIETTLDLGHSPQIALDRHLLLFAEALPQINRLRKQLFDFDRPAQLRISFNDALAVAQLMSQAQLTVVGRSKQLRTKGLSKNNLIIC